MSEARLPAALEASAIRRAVEAAGGFAAIAHKGDADRGSLLLIIRQRGNYVTALERALDLGSEGYQWRRCGPAQADSSNENLQEFISKRIRFDPDSWLIDLDVADAERFIVETGGEG